MNRTRRIVTTLAVCAAIGATAMSARAEVHPVLARALCLAAVQDSTLGPQFEVLLERGLLSYADVPQVLNTVCDGGRTLMQAVVHGRHAENLEYVVIDLGLDAEAPLLRLAGETLSLQQFLQRSAVDSEPAVRRFASEYLRDFRDAEFNPNLVLSTLPGHS